MSKRSSQKTVANSEPNARFVELNNHLQLHLPHATTMLGRSAWQGRNQIPLYRIFLICRTRGKTGGFVKNHSPGKKILRFRPGWIYFMPSDCDLEFSFDPGMRFLGFHFRLELFSGYDLLQDRKSLMEWQGDPGRISEMEKTLSDLKNVGQVARIRGMFLSLLADLCTLPLSRLGPVLAAQGKYHSLFEFAEKKLRAGTTLKEAAACMNLSVPVLSRQFSRDLGVPLKSFLDRKIFQRASAALLSSDQKIRVIADELGFSSEFYFSRFIKKHSGLPPRDYRQVVSTSAS